MSTFLVMLREGAEAAVIVAIVLAYLRSLGRPRESRWVWGGVVAASLVSAAVGVTLHATVGSLEGRSEEVVEGVAALSAVGLLSWMVLWMAERAPSLRSRLEGDVAVAAGGGGGWALAAVGFVAVVREGLETVLFLLAASTGARGAVQLVGGLGGLAAAAAIGVTVFQGGARFDLRRFFRVTGAVVILFAAGLLSRGVHELQEAGLLPVVVDPLWDLGFGDPEESTTGRVAAEVLGWTPAPSLTQVAAYCAYLVPVALAFWRRTRRPVTAGVTPAPAGRR